MSTFDPDSDPSPLLSARVPSVPALAPAPGPGERAAASPGRTAAYPACRVCAIGSGGAGSAAWER
jgi:hypothetical protein